MSASVSDTAEGHGESFLKHWLTSNRLSGLHKKLLVEAEINAEELLDFALNTKEAIQFCEDFQVPGLLQKRFIKALQTFPAAYAQQNGDKNINNNDENIPKLIVATLSKEEEEIINKVNAQRKINKTLNEKIDNLLQNINEKEKLCDNEINHIFSVFEQELKKRRDKLRADLENICKENKNKLLSSKQKIKECNDKIKNFQTKNTQLLMNWQMDKNDRKQQIVQNGNNIINNKSFPTKQTSQNMVPENITIKLKIDQDAAIKFMSEMGGIVGTAAPNENLQVELCASDIKCDDEKLDPLTEWLKGFEAVLTSIPEWQTKLKSLQINKYEDFKVNTQTTINDGQQYIWKSIQITGKCTLSNSNKTDGVTKIKILGDVDMDSTNVLNINGGKTLYLEIVGNLNIARARIVCSPGGSITIKCNNLKFTQCHATIGTSENDVDIECNNMIMKCHDVIGRPQNAQSSNTVKLTIHNNFTTKHHSKIYGKHIEINCRNVSFTDCTVVQSTNDINVNCLDHAVFGSHCKITASNKINVKSNRFTTKHHSKIYGKHFKINCRNVSFTDHTVVQSTNDINVNCLDHAVFGSHCKITASNQINLKSNRFSTGYGLKVEGDMNVQCKTSQLTTKNEGWKISSQ